MDVESEVSDDDQVVVEEFKSDGFKSDRSNSVSGIGESSNVMEGVIGKEFVVEEGIESAVDDSCSLLF